MRRRHSALQRGVRRPPFVTADARVSHIMQLRVGDSISGVLDLTRDGMSARLAGDICPIHSEIPVENTCSIVGVGHASELNLSEEGPILSISANDVVIENVRFVFSGSHTTTSTTTRPVRCSGETYSPETLTTLLLSAAIKITGDNVTVRNCWFDGFDNAIVSSGSNTTVDSCHFKGKYNSTRSAVFLTGTYGNITRCHIESTAYGAYVTGDKSSVSDNTILAHETAIFVTSDYNRIHGNQCEGHSDGFAIALTADAKYNSVTGNVIPPDSSKGTYYFISPATSKNQYAANIGEVDLE